MLDIHPCKCRDSDLIFFHKAGGFILKLSAPVCPKCGSKNVEKINKSK